MIEGAYTIIGTKKEIEKVLQIALESLKSENTIPNKLYRLGLAIELIPEDYYDGLDDCDEEPDEHIETKKELERILKEASPKHMYR